MDWLVLLAVQGTLKSLLQHHSSKSSILRCSAFFIVQFSHPYMTPPRGLLLLGSYYSWGATPPWAIPPGACSSWESTPPEGLPQAGVYMMRHRSLSLLRPFSQLPPNFALQPHMVHCCHSPDCIFDTQALSNLQQTKRPPPGAAHGEGVTPTAL